MHTWLYANCFFHKANWNLLNVVHYFSILFSKLQVMTPYIDTMTLVDCYSLENHHHRGQDDSWTNYNPKKRHPEVFFIFKLRSSWHITLVSEEYNIFNTYIHCTRKSLVTRQQHFFLWWEPIRSTVWTTFKCSMQYSIIYTIVYCTPRTYFITWSLYFWPSLPFCPPSAHATDNHQSVLCIRFEIR